MRHATVVVALAVATLATAGCRNAAETTPVAHPNCKAAWNAPDNEANRKRVVAAGGASWDVEVSQWTGIGDPAPGHEATTTEGCSYVFFTARRWLSFGGEWEETALRWQAESEGGRPGPGQREFGATATVAADGTIR